VWDYENVNKNLNDGRLQAIEENGARRMKSFSCFVIAE
jgi:hypothetical protein